jgi:hypothetical protein
MGEVWPGTPNLYFSNSFAEKGSYGGKTSVYFRLKQ